MDKATAESYVTAWLAVESALTSGQSYTLPEGIGVQRVDASLVLRRITYWQRVVDAYTAREQGGSLSTSQAAWS